MALDCLADCVAFIGLVRSQIQCRKVAARIWKEPRGGEVAEVHQGRASWMEGFDLEKEIREPVARIGWLMAAVFPFLKQVG